MNALGHPTPSRRGKHMRDGSVTTHSKGLSIQEHIKPTALAGFVIVAISLGLLLTYNTPGDKSFTGQPEPIETDTQGVQPPADEPTVDESLSGWVVGEDGVSRYYDPKSHAPFLGWLKEGDSTFYFDGVSAEPHLGWLDLGGNRYWFDNGSQGHSGVLMKNQWLTTDDGEYYLTSDGSVAVGWKQLDDNWHYFDQQGRRQTGWIDDGSGKIYWIRPEDGTLPHHEWIEIDGVFQAFDDDGSWVHGEEVLPSNDEENVANMSTRQQSVINACDFTPWPGKSLCAAWVSDVFVNAGEPSVDGDACDIARAWCTSDDLDDLKPGMVIAVTTHSRTENGRIWGHVCIYAGNGLVRDSGADSTRWVTLGSWFAWYGILESPKWGWANEIPLTEEW